MRSIVVTVASLAVIHHGFAAPLEASDAPAQQPITNVQLGPRPYFLIDNIDPGPLKDKLLSCSELEMKPTQFSIGHRGGGTLLMPEETHESMVAGPRMGAGVVECDVVFTSDQKLVCRHSQCDLHSTTNIVTIPELNAKCTVPFTPAGPNGTQPATATCCTSDITQAEFKTLCGKMDGVNASATTPQDFLNGTPRWRTDLYSTCGTVMTHAEYIELVDGMGLQFTPELKTPEVPMPFGGPGSNYTQQVYAQQMIDEYKSAGIDLKRLWPQSFLYDDLLYWLQAEPGIAGQLMFLDESGDTPETYAAAVENLTEYAAAGVKIMAPPLPYLVAVGDDGKSIVPSEYAFEAKRLGLKLVSWSLERSGFLGDGSAGGYYYESIANVTNNDGDVFNLLNVLAEDVGVLGMFSDWSATVTYYANCFGHFPTYEDWVD